MYVFGRFESCVADGGRVPVNSHTGDRHALLRRFDRKAALAVLRGPSGIAQLGPKLLTWTADARNLRTAWDHLKQYGGAAPGPNGMTYDDLADNEAWELCRVLGQAIHKDSYRPGRDREVSIPKSSGRGMRTLRLQNIEDRVAARAVVQIIQPLLDPGFDTHSFGYRPRLDRRHALAKAKHLVEDEDRLVLLLEDVKDAFDQVPLKRLLDVIRKRLPQAEGLWTLIESIIANGSKRGLRQGSPLSPLLLNLYLDHVLDRVWRKQVPDTPLLRSADDLLVLCRTQEEALEAQDLLRRILTPAGMPLKESDEPNAIRNLNHHKADWLGFEISKGENGLEVRISATAWSALTEGISLAHQKPAPPLRAVQIVKGWIDQIGPCFPHEDRDQVIIRITEMAKRMSFDELSEVGELRRHWCEAYSRWRKLCDTPLSVSLSTSRPDHAVSDDDGSADRHVFCAAKRRSDGAPGGAPSLSFSPDEKVTLYTDGSYDPFTREGGWAVIFVAPSLSFPVRGSGRLQRATNNRAELIAVIKGLECLVVPTQLQIVSDSEYVVRGIIELRPKWKSQGWRAGSGRHKCVLKNADLWRKLDALLIPHTVTCKWVRGHSGHQKNEECDRLAYAAGRR